MTQIRIAALADLKGQIPTAHYAMRPRSIDADLELTRLLLGSPEGLTLREHRAAHALEDWAFFEKRSRTIIDKAYPIRDCDDPTPAPGMTPDKQDELIGRREVHRRSALEYATAIGDALLMARYQAPATDTAPAQSPATLAPEVAASDGPAMRREKKPTIESVAMEYMREVYKNGQFQSATKFHKHLTQVAGATDSKFEMGTGINSRKLFCPAASSFFDPGTLSKMWAKIRAV